MVDKQWSRRKGYVARYLPLRGFGPGLRSWPVLSASQALVRLPEVRQVRRHRRETDLDRPDPQRPQGAIPDLRQRCEARPVALGPGGDRQARLFRAGGGLPRNRTTRQHPLCTCWRTSILGAILLTGYLGARPPLKSASASRSCSAGRSDYVAPHRIAPVQCGATLRGWPWEAWKSSRIFPASALVALRRAARDRLPLAHFGSA
jgi:hypothetical protein